MSRRLFPKIVLHLRGVTLIALLFLTNCAGLEPSPIKSDVVATAATEAVEEVEPRGVIIEETHSLNEQQQNAFNTAVAYLQENRLDDAIAFLEPLVAEQPHVTAPYINLGKAYRLNDEQEKAEATLMQALQLIDAHPLATQELTLLLSQSGRFDDARSRYEASLAIYPDYLPLRKNLGILCDIYLNDTACALEQFEYYHELNPEDAKVKLWISEIELR